MAFSTVTILCNHYHSHVPEYFYHPKKKPCTYFQSPLFLLPPACGSYQSFCLYGSAYFRSPKTLYKTSTAAKSLQSCLTLYDPIDSSPLGTYHLSIGRTPLPPPLLLAVMVPLCSYTRPNSVEYNIADNPVEEKIITEYSC